MTIPIYVLVPMQGERFWKWIGSQPQGATEQEIEIGWAKHNAMLIARLLHEHTLIEA